MMSTGRNAFEIAIYAVILSMYNNAITIITVEDKRRHLELMVFSLATKKMFTAATKLAFVASHAHENTLFIITYLCLVNDRLSGN